MARRSKGSKSSRKKNARRSGIGLSKSSKRSTAVKSAIGDRTGSATPPGLESLPVITVNQFYQPVWYGQKLIAECPDPPAPVIRRVLSAPKVHCKRVVVKGGALASSLKFQLDRHSKGGGNNRSESVKRLEERLKEYQSNTDLAPDDVLVHERGSTYKIKRMHMNKPSNLVSSSAKRVLPTEMLVSNGSLWKKESAAQDEGWVKAAPAATPTSLMDHFRSVQPKSEPEGEESLMSSSEVYPTSSKSPVPVPPLTPAEDKNAMLTGVPELKCFTCNIFFKNEADLELHFKVFHVSSVSTPNDPAGAIKNIFGRPHSNIKESALKQKTTIMFAKGSGPDSKAIGELVDDVFNKAMGRDVNTKRVQEKSQVLLFKCKLCDATLLVGDNPVASCQVHLRDEHPGCKVTAVDALKTVREDNEVVAKIEKKSSAVSHRCRICSAVFKLDETQVKHTNEAHIRKFHAALAVKRVECVLEPISEMRKHADVWIKSELSRLNYKVEDSLLKTLPPVVNASKVKPIVSPKTLKAKKVEEADTPGKGEERPRRRSSRVKATTDAVDWDEAVAGTSSSSPKAKRHKIVQETPVQHCHSPDRMINKTSKGPLVYDMKTKTWNNIHKTVAPTLTKATLKMKVDLSKDAALDPPESAQSIVADAAVKKSTSLAHKCRICKLVSNDLNSAKLHIRQAHAEILNRSTVRQDSFIETICVLRCDNSLKMDQNKPLSKNSYSKFNSQFFNLFEKGFKPMEAIAEFAKMDSAAVKKSTVYGWFADFQRLERIKTKRDDELNDKPPVLQFNINDIHDPVDKSEFSDIKIEIDEETCALTGEAPPSLEQEKQKPPESAPIGRMWAFKKKKKLSEDDIMRQGLKPLTTSKGGVGPDSSSNELSGPVPTELLGAGTPELGKSVQRVFRSSLPLPKFCRRKPMTVQFGEGIDGHNMNVYECEKCLKVFVDRSAAVTHLGTQHGVKDAGGHACSYCHLNFTTKVYLDDHISKKHAGNVGVKPGPPNNAKGTATAYLKVDQSTPLSLDEILGIKSEIADGIEMDEESNEDDTE